ncbi:MAG TPA: riboflavin synthase [Spirochaetota bacterium]|nr:riboflavin synthase [Spirochaetota bacterium]HPN82725.1 riboflavin synthase [Spirochaetota bacterium]
MFSGIISAVGSILASRQTGAGREISVQADPAWLDGVQRGESIAINGACQTVTEFRTGVFTVFASNETLSCTNLGTLGQGGKVNLERSLVVGGRIDGHLVSGHVDTRARIVFLRRYDNTIELGVELPLSVAPLVAPKGSLAVDGISLTVHTVRGNTAGFVLIPESVGRTTVPDWEPGYEVNLEVDLVARYLARIMECRGMTGDARFAAVLEESGFGPGIRRED